jgi:3-methyladenine DNA glycosylase AlkD
MIRIQLVGKSMIFYSCILNVSKKFIALWDASINSTNFNFQRAIIFIFLVFNKNFLIERS